MHYYLRQAGFRLVLHEKLAVELCAVSCHTLLSAEWQVCATMPSSEPINCNNHSSLSDCPSVHQKWKLSHCDSHKGQSAVPVCFTASGELGPISRMRVVASVFRLKLSLLLTVFLKPWGENRACSACHIVTLYWGCHNVILYWGCHIVILYWGVWGRKKAGQEREKTLTRPV